MEIENMASIRKRNGRYQAQIRRKGYSEVSKTFSSRDAAKKWVKATETDMERGEFRPKVNMTVGELIKRFERDVAPKHKASRSTIVRCRNLCRHIGSVPMTKL
ncbi:MAG: hypothetical protein VYB33_12055, partial [Pseudomonadota bacterium]|nr:hypothetical protein [Pseudomonadota bacterium]